MITWFWSQLIWSSRIYVFTLCCCRERISTTWWVWSSCSFYILRSYIYWFWFWFYSSWNDDFFSFM